MKKSYCFSLLLLLCISTGYTQSSLDRIYEYDASGNRTCRRIITLRNHVVSTDTTDTENADYENTAHYFSEKVGKIQFNIFPNPTSQTVTVHITNYDDFTVGTLQLYSLNGQFLQQYVINSPQLNVDLSTYSNGVYLLKLRINQQTDVWKIVKE